MRLTAQIGAVACLVALAAACRPSTARANVDWTLSGVTFSDGGTASGTFVTDNSGDLLSADITTTTTASFTGETYSTSNPSISSASDTTDILLIGTGDVILIGFDDRLTAIDSPDAILT